MRIGILGGSFNPVHIGHVRMAIEVREQLGLDRVEMVPAMEPPHKDGSGILPFDLRVDMVRRAVEDVDGVVVNTLEGDRPGPSYTCDTLECYRTLEPQTALSFIMGASTFLELTRWRRGLDLPKLASLVVVNRWEAHDEVPKFIDQHWVDAKRVGDDQWHFPDGYDIHLLDIPRLDVKGGHIRRRWLDGRSLRFLVPQGVEDELNRKREVVESYWK